jgi:hypothetical protein
MPNFDGTGPMGMGPMTGRGLGPCGGFASRGWGMGWRRGFGRGRGLGRFFGWGGPQTQKEQLKALAEYKKALEEELEDLRKEEEELNKGE